MKDGHAGGPPFAYNGGMSDTANETGGNIDLGPSLALTIPPELVRDFKAAAGRGDVRQKIIEALQDWIDERNAAKRLAEIDAGKVKPVPWNQVKQELGL